MRTVICSILLLLTLTTGVYSQNNHMISLNIAPKQIEVQYQRHILTGDLWAGIFAGVGNQDINSRYDDLFFGFRGEYYLWRSHHNQAAITVGSGIYLPNNDYYRANVLFADGGVRFNHLFGKAKNQRLIISTGYRYGKKSYTQHMSSGVFDVITTGVFCVSPVYATIGYGFAF